MTVITKFEPTSEFDQSFGYNIIAGIDEVGRGPWAGPVVAAAVIIKDYSILPTGINDSKKLSAEQREIIYEKVIEIVDYGIGIVAVDIIDKIGVGKASLLAMENAYDNLSKKAEVILVDGNQKPNIKGNIVNIIKGDAKSIAIATSSIIAKVTRDRIMAELAKSHPEYAWYKNAGYGTKTHIEAIEKHGITEHHRKSFKPIREFITK